MYQAILSHICKHVSLDEEEEAFLTSQFNVTQLKRKEFLLQQGNTCQYIHFVNEGILRAYFLNPEGKETTVMFAVKDWWITDMYCFTNQLPAMVSIQAVAPSQVLCLSKERLDTLLTEIPKLERWFRILMQNAYIREQLRVIQNLSQSAEERYYQFLEKYPQIVPHVTQKQIASYLGITPEFLSAIRAQK